MPTLSETANVCDVDFDRLNLRLKNNGSQASIRIRGSRMQDEYFTMAALAGVSIPVVGACYIAYVCTNPGGDGAIIATVLAAITGIVTYIGGRLHERKRH